MAKSLLRWQAGLATTPRGEQQMTIKRQQTETPQVQKGGSC